MMGDPICPAIVPGTDFVIVPPGSLYEPMYILRNGVRDDLLTQRVLSRFATWPRNAATARCVACWLREGAP